MREGLIIEFSCGKWVVVNVNDCRATVIPLAGKDPLDPNEVFDETNPKATGISPNSECRTFGFVKGHIQKRERITISRKAVDVPARSTKGPISMVKTTVESSKHQKKLITGALPDIPEDVLPMDPVITSVLISTQCFFSLR